MENSETEAFSEFLMDKERSQNTIAAYVKAVELFFEDFKELNKKNMLEFKQLQIQKWKVKTANARIIAMNQYCIFKGHPEYCVKGFKIQQATSLENVITIEEYKKLLSGLYKDGNERGYWMVQFLAKTGARASEFINLPIDSLEKGYCEMWTKGKFRRIYIPQTLIEESRVFFEKQNSDFLFPNRYGRKMSTRGLAQLIRNWAKKYGIRKEVAHPHAFRHLYAIQFLHQNQNIALLADLMGHSSVSTTSIYLRLSKEEQIRQFNEAAERW